MLVGYHVIRDQVKSCRSLDLHERPISETLPLYAAKCILIFWCLYAFIAAGFEHSVANMTVFGVALLSEHPEAMTAAGALRNLFWVTLGNTLSGAAFMGVGYWLVAARPELPSEASLETIESKGFGA